MFDDLDAEELLRHERPWHEAVGKLQALRLAHCEEAQRRLAEIQERYVNRRPAMIVDAVISVQQDYERTVLSSWNASTRHLPPASLEAPGELEGIDQTLFNNSPKRTTTIVGVARGLLRYGQERGLDDEQAARSWARVTDGLEFA